MRLSFAVVPPMSKATTSSQPACRARKAAPMAPAAGPDSTSAIGCSPAARAVVMPPSESMTKSGTPSER